MASIQNVSDLVESFVSGDLPVSEFANRFAPIFKEALKSPDAALRSVALAVHAQISHHFNTLLSEKELKSSLAPYGTPLNQPVVSVLFAVTMAPPALQQAFALDERGELVPV